MKLYEYIDQHVPVQLLLTMIHLIIVLNDYAAIQELYYDAKRKTSLIFNQKNVFEHSNMRKPFRYISNYLLEYYHYQ